MSGTTEYGKCQCCHRVGSLKRTYFIYDIDCECCHMLHKGKKVHFHVIIHCDKCTPAEPINIKVLLKPDKYKIKD